MFQEEADQASELLARNLQMPATAFMPIEEGPHPRGTGEGKDVVWSAYELKRFYTLDMVYE